MLVSFLAFRREINPEALDALITNAINLGELEKEDDSKSGGDKENASNRWFPSFFSPWSPIRVCSSLSRD